MKELEEIKKLVMTIPNDQQLGDSVRFYINKLSTDKHNFIQCRVCGKYQTIINLRCDRCMSNIKSDE
jgi:uncharacterized OB-fold protein